MPTRRTNSACNPAAPRASFRDEGAFGRYFRLVMTGGKTFAEVTKEFDLTESALRGWVKRAEADALVR